MFEYLKAELPKLGVKQEVQEPSTRVQDVAKQQAANQTSAGTVDNTKPARNEIPTPSVSMGRRPFA